MEEKTRNLSLDDYLDILQKEYFICEIRSIIYPRYEDKKYWKFQMNRKKEKVVGLSQRLQVGNIFDNEEIRNKYYKEIYPIDFDGLPRFDLNDKYQLVNNDVVHYYSEGASVRIKVDGKDKFGKITKVDLKKNSVTVEFMYESEGKEYNIQNVTRLF